MPGCIVALGVASRRLKWVSRFPLLDMHPSCEIPSLNEDTLWNKREISRGEKGGDYTKIL